MNSKPILNIAVALVLISLMVGMSGCGAELADKAPAAALVGTWELTTESERGTRTRELVINEDLNGTYKGRNREFPVTDLTVEGDQVSFNIEMSFGERKFVLEFAGTLENDSLNGEFTTPRGSREVTGKRAE
jgi:hypothetical protein